VHTVRRGDAAWTQPIPENGAAGQEGTDAILRTGLKLVAELTRPRDVTLAEQFGDSGKMSPPATPPIGEAAPPPIGEGDRDAVAPLAIPPIGEAARDTVGGCTTVALIGDSERCLACTGAIMTFDSDDGESQNGTGCTMNMDGCGGECAITCLAGVSDCRAGFCI